jgi:hypothetical protein
MDTVILIIAFLLMLFVQGWVLYYKTYWTKKGENLATKEDLAELTRTSEQIKAELSIVAGNQIGVKSEKRAAIIHYNETLSRAISTLGWEVLSSSGSSAKDVPFANYVENIFPAHTAARSRVQLFIDNREIDDLLQEITDGLGDATLNNQENHKKLRAALNDPQPNAMRLAIQEYAKTSNPIQKKLHTNHMKLLVLFRKELS